MKKAKLSIDELAIRQLLITIMERLNALDERITDLVLPNGKLNSKQAAKYLNIKMNWLNKLCSQGKLTYEKSGKIRFFDRSELDRHRSQIIKKSDAQIDDEAEQEMMRRSHGVTFKMVL